MSIRLPCVIAVDALLSGGADLIASADRSDRQGSSSAWFDSGKLLATAGASEIEGAGGALVSWALTTGCGTSLAIGANVQFAHIVLPDYTIERGCGAIRALYKTDDRRADRRTC